MGCDHSSIQLSVQETFSNKNTDSTSNKCDNSSKGKSIKKTKIFPSSIHVVSSPSAVTLATNPTSSSIVTRVSSISRPTSSILPSASNTLRLISPIFSKSSAVTPIGSPCPVTTHHHPCHDPTLPLPRTSSHNRQLSSLLHKSSYHESNRMFTSFYRQPSKDKDQMDTSSSVDPSCHSYFPSFRSLSIKNIVASISSIQNYNDGYENDKSFFDDGGTSTSINTSQADIKTSSGKDGTGTGIFTIQQKHNSAGSHSNHSNHGSYSNHSNPGSGVTPRKSYHKQLSSVNVMSRLSHRLSNAATPTTARGNNNNAPFLTSPAAAVSRQQEATAAVHDLQQILQDMQVTNVDYHDYDCQSSVYA